MLEPTFCRLRQRRLLEILRNRSLDAAVISNRIHVYWLTGHWAFWLHESAAVLSADGHVTLISANAPTSGLAVDTSLSFPATQMGTQDQRQPAILVAALSPALRQARTIGFDASPVSALLRDSGTMRYEPIDEDLHHLRRRKEADELALMRRAIGCCEAMYAKAREIIAPGVSELTVFTELHSAAVHAAGETLTPMHLGNDFACGVGGGSPRANRLAKAGEIYILDLGPAYRGYFSDNARAFAVGGKPTDVQLQIWQALTGVFPIIERTAKPGVRCRDLFDAGKAYLLEKTGRTLDHHLGHGVGLQPHEYPHISPAWDDVLEVGDVFTIEPGLYGPDINGGMRIENQYLVTETGVENLTPSDLSL